MAACAAGQITLTELRGQGLNPGKREMVGVVEGFQGRACAKAAEVRGGAAV
jgi:hypothetical protein